MRNSDASCNTCFLDYKKLLAKQLRFLTGHLVSEVDEAHRFQPQQVQRAINIQRSHLQEEQNKLSPLNAGRISQQSVLWRGIAQYTYGFLFMFLWQFIK